ncbi:multifunctional CCA addition/repair protein [Kingella negevensis]|uniref:multifunctional CCA addition/repair protein n=1 Tax=Kingella negevensis TaxID=1522312 RepID=UPI00254CD1F8|nr:multifunctional CCA addition/repair protein [Kingella negevensis]MDK4680729.1 multifunctional CCA addition/repair protein [Kingella negevensis]MDK4681548.1 multifunctional CCA addition/repair protein [Kingella negevensis]MDK4691935.1 multifunctional CCA addition/repair protein [Kingella negevensis]MDK4692912.1 multifunctional CCA addition/repair protein [Kingella negevensis]MDK4699211.1 multifunctional CCA addition/repair protein [Kingella negevensis]
MQIYLVGGAVRDKLLGLDVKDHDWVVVGANAETLLQQGFQSVGKDFPVFLHPQTHEEYALARTECKTGKGYAGFAFHADESVTLEQDLLRRDLTINAMAEDEHGNIIDLFGGKADLRDQILRHVSPAFAEDPVRILRIARFAARYGFAVAPETMALMREMVANGEVNALVAERVWQEFAKGLMEKQPRRMIEILRECGALRVLLPEVDALFGVPQRADYHPEICSGKHTLLVLQRTADLTFRLPERYAALLHDVGKALTPKDILPKHIGHDMRGVDGVRAVNARWKVPKNCAELAELVCKFHIRLHQVGAIKDAKKVLKVLKEMDAFRRPERFQAVLNVCMADQQGRLGWQDASYPQREHWLAVLAAAQSVDTAAIARAFADKPKEISEQIDKARACAIASVQENFRLRENEHND